MALTTGQAVAGVQFASAMKTFYLEPLEDIITRASALLNRLERNSEDVNGNFAYVALEASRNPGVGSRKDTDGSGPLLPKAGAQKYDSATFRMAYHYLRAAVSGPVMRASKNAAGAFARALDIEMKGLTKRAKEDLNRQLWSYGHGRAGTLDASAGAGVTFEMSSTSIFSAKVNDRVHFADKAAFANPDPSAGTTVKQIDFDTDSAGNASTTKHRLILNDATAAGVTTTADALYFGIADTSASVIAEDSSKSQEMFGIPAVVDDGALAADEKLAGDANEFLHGNLNFGGIDRTVGANTFWRSKVLQNPDGIGTLRPVTVALLEEAFLNYVHVGGGDVADLDMYTDPGLFATIGLLHIGDRIFNDFKKTLEGGFIALSFNERPIFADRDAPRNNIWFLDMSTLILLTQSGYDFMDKDGAVLQRISNRDAYEFTLFRDVQLASRDPSRNVRLSDCKATFNVNWAVG